MSKPKFYIIRRRKDDSIVAVGSAQECMVSMGIKSYNVFQSTVCRNRSGKYKTYEIDIEYLDEEVY